MQWKKHNRHAPAGMQSTDGFQSPEGGAAIWPMNIGGKTVWRIWINGDSATTTYRGSEAEAKAYVEAMLPFVQLQALK